VRGLASLHNESLLVTGVAPTGSPHQSIDDLELKRVTAPVRVELLTRLWSRWPLGVPRSSDVVHATSLAGPYRGGAKLAVNSLALHDLLWRDEPSASTPRGIRFHEERLQLLRRRGDVRVILTAPGLVGRLVAEGFAPERLHEVRLGVDDDNVVPDSEDLIRAFLLERGVKGPFTLYVGTMEPRKNLERLISAHAAAVVHYGDLGTLVLVGPTGWGSVDSADAVVLGVVERSILKGLYRDASVVAYVPRAEGWGLPPVEALHAGARVVASVTTPSVTHNEEVIVVDPLDVISIEEGLVKALSLSNDDTARSRRSESVADLTWKNVALDHLASWQ
jgi:glycosyltransferase involved in cell wall biosynthesis